jgi:AraC-like DNA-binding protein
VTQLAEMANLSPSYFWALFRQKTGYAPIDFLIRLRMDQACHLLNRTKMTVNKIAVTLGYKDPLYFSRAFKSIHGVAPTLYRAAGSNAMPSLPPINLVNSSKGTASVN